MKKEQTDRLSKQQEEIGGSKGIFGENAQIHNLSVKDTSKITFETLSKEFPELEFRHGENISKKEINEWLNETDRRLGVTIFVENASVKPDGGIIEVKDKNNKWRIILVSEAKHQGKDIENIRKGILVGKHKDQGIMVAGNAIERSHKNINEIRNMMLSENHFPYVLFLQGSNFLTESIKVKRPDGQEVELKHNVGSLNRIDRLTAANYSLPINQNSCKNIIINLDGQQIMLQAVSIFTKATEWTAKEMFPIMLEISKTSIQVIGLIKKEE